VNRGGKCFACEKLKKKTLIRDIRVESGEPGDQEDQEERIKTKHIGTTCKTDANLSAASNKREDCEKFARKTVLSRTDVVNPRIVREFGLIERKLRNCLPIFDGKSEKISPDNSTGARETNRIVAIP
jgi:DNA-directed RNA polymerase beta subunit